jgi:hypothetical protein
MRQVNQDGDPASDAVCFNGSDGGNLVADADALGGLVACTALSPVAS